MCIYTCTRWSASWSTPVEALLGSHAKFLGSHARMHSFWAVMRFLDRFEKPCRVKAALGSHFRPFAEIGLGQPLVIDSGFLGSHAHTECF